MRWLALLLPLTLFACSPEPTSSEPTDAGTEALEAGDACVAFDAGPASDGATSGTTVTRAEIDAILAVSCSIGSCHGNAPGGGRLHLPKAPGNWVPNVVNQPSTEHKTMKRVVPGDPSNSFFVHKLTDGLCAMNKDCVDNNCGDRMPQANPPLDAADLNKIVEWVRQGAKE